MRTAFAIFLFLHGFAHLPGFIVPWRIAGLDEMPYKTTLLSGTVNVGDIGIRAVGIVWLVITLLFALTGIGMLAQMAWWKPVAAITLLFSFLLCILCWPDTRIGLFVNLVILLCLLAINRMGWAW
jgi:hypothetical protein